jgi:hypothetical protein
MLRKPDHNEFESEIKRGNLVATPGALETFTAKELKTALHRHMRLDWSDMDAEDRAANLRAAMEGGERVLSAYRVRVTGKQRPDLWIITEADRSVTTLLLPKEY